MPDEGTSGTGSGSPNPASPGGQPADIGQLVAAAVAAELTKSVLPAVNAAITSRFNQHETKLAEKFAPKTEPSHAPPADDGKPPKTADEVAALKTRLHNVETERAKERENNLRLEREADLRRALGRSELNVVNVDAAMRIVMPDLKVGQDNRFFHDGAQGLTSVDDYVASFVKANPWLQSPSGRSGGGGTGNPAHGAQGNNQTMTMAAYTERLRACKSEEEMQSLARAVIAAGGIKG